MYELKAPRSARGHEQRGRRYCVVVQSDSLPWSTWLVAPTSASARPGRFRPAIDLGGTATTVLVDQLAAVDPESSLDRMIGRTSAAELLAIDHALRLVLDV